MLGSVAVSVFVYETQGKSRECSWLFVFLPIIRRMQDIIISILSMPVLCCIVDNSLYCFKCMITEPADISRCRCACRILV